MKLEYKKYIEQITLWPEKGFHIMAQYDEESIIVYQAYNRIIGDFAIQNQYFGGDFSMYRMTWIKPNFLWMMYRNGWGSKENQEVTLAIKIKRTAFELFLSQGVYSTYSNDLNITKEEWEKQIKHSNIRLQWDPDHNPIGDKLQRRAIQIGLRNDMVKFYNEKAIVGIEDISEFVREQRGFIKEKQLDKLLVPLETPLRFNSLELNLKLKLDK